MKTPYAKTSTTRHRHGSVVHRPVVLALTIVFLFGGLTSGAGAQDLQAEKLCGWDFQRADDRNADQEPDGWRRVRDRQHPAYVDMKIVSRDLEAAQEAIAAQMLLARVAQAFKSGRWDPHYVPESIPSGLAHFMDRHVLDNCLQISMDGGAAELVSPRFRMDPRFSYNLQAELSCLGLHGHEAWVELHLLDSNESTLAIMATRRVTDTHDWERMTTEIASTASSDLRWGRVHVKVKPREQLMITGIARFDRISVHRLPRLSLTTEAPNYIIRPGDELEVRCSAMGIDRQCTSVRFQLRDHLDRLLSKESVPLQATSVPQFSSKQAAVATARSASSPLYVAATPRARQASRTPSAPLASEEEDGFPDVYDGVAIWKLQLDSPGLYRVAVDLGNDSVAQRRDILIGVVPTRDKIAAGPFGWSIPAFDARLRPEDVPALVERFGAGWVKFPVWFDAADTAYADSLVAMAERLQALGAECVGRLDQPPATQRSLFGEGNEHLHAAAIFREPTAWEPILEPVLTRIGLKLDWFQLGDDADTSFLSNFNMPGLVADTRGRMQTYSQELKLALNWDWLTEINEESAVPWNALHYSANPQLTAAELASYAKQAATRRSNVWVNIEPLDGARYSLLDRVRDLTERMIAIKRSQITAAYVLHPFDARRGLFDSQQRVGEMLIPWTNLVTAMGAGEHIGSIALPEESINHIFQSGKHGVMIAWSDQPRTEQIYLGDDIRISDVWGRPVPVETAMSDRGTPEQRFEVGSWPILIHGVNTEVVRWRQSLQVLTSNLASKGGEQKLPIAIENTFTQTATGKLSLFSPSLLRDANEELPLQLPVGGPHRRELPIMIRPDASAGHHDLRFDIDVIADKPYHFSVHRSITLGTGDIEFLWDLSRKDDTTTNLRVELTNNTSGPVSFDCKYFPPGKPYQRFQILDAAPGNTLHEFALPLPAGQQAEQAWIRCEEIGTGRVLNYRLTP